MQTAVKQNCKSTKIENNCAKVHKITRKKQKDIKVNKIL